MLNAIQWNSELIRRYDLSGPRYTSYPTATQFHSKISSFDLIQALNQSKSKRNSLSIYVHIPFCAHVCYYCACNKFITKDRGRSANYIKSLHQEMRLISHHLDQRQLVEQLHFGGGTPTFLSHTELKQLMADLKKHFLLLDDDSGDYGIEIDPREADWATMGLLRELGFNRISLGVQDFDANVQRAVNRLQSYEETRAIVDAAHAMQFRSVNIDLIYGLPLQTPESFAKTVSEVIALQPDRLSIFNYAHLPTRFMPQRRIASENLPSANHKLLMLQETIEQLTNAGYRYIGMDHFALPDDELAIAQEENKLQRNFQGYTTHAHCDLIGLGVSAISNIGNLYAQNSNDLREYQDTLGAGQLATVRGLICTEEDELRHTVIQKLICHFSLTFSEVEATHSIRFKEHFHAIWPQLETFAHDGLINIDSEKISVTPAGRLLIRTICMAFDEHLKQQEKTNFSRVI